MRHFGIYEGQYGKMFLNLYIFSTSFALVPIAPKKTITPTTQRRSHWMPPQTRSTYLWLFPIRPLFLIMGVLGVSYPPISFPMAIQMSGFALPCWRVYFLNLNCLGILREIPWSQTTIWGNRVTKPCKLGWLSPSTESTSSGRIAEPWGHRVKATRSWISDKAFCCIAKDRPLIWNVCFPQGDWQTKERTFGSHWPTLPCTHWISQHALATLAIAIVKIQ